MASLEELLNTGLGGIIQSGGIPTEDALYNRQAQAERESTFGRGLGISSVTRDALAKARVDASLAAQQAQLAALGQAAGYVGANANRAQNESQFSRNLSQQKNMANTQLLASGLGAGLGAVGQVAGGAFGPEIRTGLRGAVGKGPLNIDKNATSDSVPANTYVGGPSPMPQFSDPTGVAGGADLGALTDFANIGGGSGGGGDLSNYFDPGMFGGGRDLSTLFDQSYNPWQYGYD